MIHRPSPRSLAIAGWLIGFPAAIWLLDFLIGGPLATLAYLRLGAREPWRLTGPIVVGTGLFLYVMAAWLHVPFPPGILPAWPPS